MKETFSIAQNLCIRCGICIEICPANVIEKSESGQTQFNTQNIPICLGCGQCMAACKPKAIVAGGLSYENDFENFSVNNDFISLLETRRSVRRFLPKPVEKDCLNRILYAISTAPHGDSHQHVEITVVNSRDLIMKSLPHMVQFYQNLKSWLKNPIIRRVIQAKEGKDTLKTLDTHILPRIQRGVYNSFSFDYDGITRGAHTIVLFHAEKDSEEHIQDSLIFVTYATLAAHNLGLGSTINGLIPPAINKQKELKQLFNIPVQNKVVTSLIVGYPKYKYHRKIKRQLKSITWLE